MSEYSSVNEAIKGLYGIQGSLLQIYERMCDSYDAGIPLGDDGNLELFTKIENEVAALLRSFILIRRG